MPTLRCPNGKWKIGARGKCVYPSKKVAERAFRGFLGSRHARGKGKKGK